MVWNRFANHGFNEIWLVLTIVCNGIAHITNGKEEEEGEFITEKEGNTFDLQTIAAGSHCILATLDCER